MLEEFDNLPFHTRQSPEQIEEMLGLVNSINVHIHNDIKYAKNLSQELIDLAGRFLSQDFLSQGLYYYGVNEYSIGNCKNAIIYCEKAMRLSTKNDTMSRCLVLQGAIYIYFSRFDKAIEVYNDAINISTVEKTGSILNNMASVYFKQKKFKKAIEYFEKSLAVSEIDENTLLTILNNIARSYIELEQYKEAKAILDKLYDLLQNTLNIPQTMVFELTYGLYFYKTHQYEEAYEKLASAYISCIENGFKNQIYSATLFLALVCSKSGRLNKAGQYYLECMDFVKDLDIRLYNDALKYYIDFLNEQGDFERALPLFYEFNSNKDKIIQEEKEKELETLHAQFNNREQELQIDKLKREKEYQQQLLSQADEIRLSNEKLKEINQNLSDFSYALSHDIRTPIRQLAAYSSMLLRKDFSQNSEQVKADIQFIFESAQKADKMIQDLHQFSIAGIQEDKFQLISLEACLHDALKILHDDIVQKNIRIHQSQQLPMFLGDKTLMTQVFQNLIGNSIKYKRANIDCEIFIEYKEIGQIKRITILDNGSGIAKEEQDNVFGLFNRSLQHQHIEGNGIGLSYCRKILSKMHAHIHLYSEGADKGTSVYIDY